MAKAVAQQPPLRVFVSSTYEDMLPYREAVTNALMSIEQLPIGMEHFVSSPNNPLDDCLADIRRSQIYIVVVGMKYGSIDAETGKSFTELEYDEAIKNNIPVLAFVIDEKKQPILPIYVDTGESAEKLKRFKARIDERMTQRFTTADNLKDLVVRSVNAQVKRFTETADSEQVDNTEEEYIKGAKAFRKFLILPERYKGVDAVLRVRMDGGFSTWKRRDEFFQAFDVKPGETLIGRDVYVLGIELEDIPSDEQDVDFYAEGELADWVLDNNVSTGTIFEGKFKFAYETVEGVASRGLGMAVDAKIAALILLEGKTIIDRIPMRKKKRDKVTGKDELAQILNLSHLTE